MIKHLIAELGEKLDLTAEELADIIWLTLKRQQGTNTDPTASKAEVVTVVEQNSVEQNSSAKLGASSPPPETTSISKRQPTTEPAVGIAPRRAQTTPLNRLPIKVANPSSIRDPLALARSLRPLIRRVPSGQIEGLDEQATVQQIAEAGIWQPIVKPALEPWLELVLVADETASMLIWRQTVLEFRKLLRNYGAFRDVQLWGLYWESERLCLRPGIGSEALNSTPRHPKEILDPSGRRLIVLITDCVAAHWQSKALMKTLKLWSQHSPVAIAQVLPEWLWVRTAIRGFEPVQLKALEPGMPNSQLVIDWSSVWQAESDEKAGVCVPIVPLEPDSVLTWSQMVMGQSEAPGYWLQAFTSDPEESKPASLSPEQRVERFQVMSSPVAQRLMGLVAASPAITLPVIRLIQETLLPKSRQMNVAEVLLGGLLEPINLPQLGANPDEVEYRFVDEAIRDLLLAETPVTDTVRVLSEYVERQFDKSLEEFVAELQVWSQSEDAALVDKTRPFATVTASVLKRKGRKYREFVQQIEHHYSPLLEQKSSSSKISNSTIESNIRNTPVRKKKKEAKRDKLQLIHTLRGHEDVILRINWSPNGKLLATPSVDKTIRLWDGVEGTEIGKLEGHAYGVNHVAWSPDGKILASASFDRTIRIWNVETRECYHIIQAHNEDIGTIAWSSDGRILASGAKDATVRLWNTDNWQMLMTLEGHTEDVTRVAWSPHQKLLASCSTDRTVRLWNIDTGEVQRVFRGHKQGVICVAWSPDQEFLVSTSHDNTIRIWNPNTSKLIHSIIKHKSTVTCASFSPNGRILASKGMDSTVRLFNCKNWQEIEILKEISSSFWPVSIAFHPLRAILATLGEKDRVIRIWELLPR